MIKRISTLGQFTFYGYSQYIREIETNKITESGNAVIEDNAVEMTALPGHLGRKINLLVG